MDAIRLSTNADASIAGPVLLRHYDQVANHYWTNAYNFISGPFDFAIVNNKKSIDRVPEHMRPALGKFSHLFTNKVPKTDLPGYTTHYSQPHTVYSDDSHHERLCAYLASPSSPSTV